MKTAGRSQLAKLVIGASLANLAVMVMGFIGGCIYAFALALVGSGGRGGGLGDRASEVLLVVGTISSLAAVVVSLATTLVIGIPLFRWSVRARHTSLGTYAWSGLGVSLTLVAVFVALHIFVDWLLVTDLAFAVLMLIIGGPVFTLTFWYLVRPDLSR